MCIFLLAGGLSLLQTTGNRAEKIGPVVLFVYLFTICYSLGEGPVAFQYSAEVFPTIQREQGMAWAVCINNTFGEQTRQRFYRATTKPSAAGVLGLTFPRMQTVMTPTGACKLSHAVFSASQFADLDSSRFLCRAQPYRLVYDLLFR